VDRDRGRHTSSSGHRGDVGARGGNEGEYAFQIGSSGCLRRRRERDRWPGVRAVREIPQGRGPREFDVALGWRQTAASSDTTR